MRQPLWRIFLHILLLAFVVQRATAAVVLHLEGADVPLIAGLGLQCLTGLLTSFGILLGKPWAVPALLATGVVVAATALYGALGAGVMSVAGALGQVLVAAVAAGGLAALLRYEEREG